MMSTEKAPATTQEDLHCIEFHRHALALLPEPDDRLPGVAFLVKNGSLQHDQRFCTCTTSKQMTCHHLLRLTRVARYFRSTLGKQSMDEHFRASIFYKLASVLAQQAPCEPHNIQWRSNNSQDNLVISGFDEQGTCVVTYHAQDGSYARLFERLDPGDNIELVVPHRGAILRQLSLHTLSQNERALMDAGMRSIRMAIEESLWYKLFYHAYREFGDNGCSFRPVIDEVTGGFIVNCEDTVGNILLRVEIPRKAVMGFIREMGSCLPENDHLVISPVPLRSIFLVNQNTQLDLEIRPAIKLIQQNGEARYYEENELKKYRYGNLVYLVELGIMAELENLDKKKRRFTTPGKMVLKRAEIPSFLDENRKEFSEGTIVLDKQTQDMNIFREYNKLEIIPSVLDRDWCWLSISYRFGNTEISLAEIIQARLSGHRYIATDEGWIDCQSGSLDHLDYLTKHGNLTREIDKEGIIKLKKIDLFMINAFSGSAPVHIQGRDKIAGQLEHMLGLKPVDEFPNLEGMASPLRPYQVHGMQWIRFLHENALGGLLCDDMGLGKTHQVMSFMVWLKQVQKRRFIVVCPTTVISHWEDKITKHAPALNACVYHGTERSIDQSLDGNDVLITSYGILRRDADILGEIPWGLAVFDEVQQIKNPQTLAHRCACRLSADMKIGMTGTPIENRIEELKALFDLVLPGYLGSDAQFSTRYAKPIENDRECPAREELRRLISPFTLRRLKQSVLDELPPKIEDIRTCLLSEDQIKLYRDAIDTRVPSLMNDLQDTGKMVPYLHIFSLLSLLKQICNHPALVDGDLENYEKFCSGKWDLFTELLAEALDSGQKVVVYSQYLGMIEIISRHLTQSGIDHVTLTGKSRNRGKLIERFNNDDDCRVFIGSLKAGGIGIDLVAASVVIHYDRWWNAAKEDQATDRVHRIGQRRGVQVFKLVTYGTLEEKIAALIDKKRSLAQSIVSEDDPGLLKTFTREELMDILSSPVSAR